MAEPEGVTPPQQQWIPSFNPWLIAVSVMLATVMEVLDTSVANVALPHIAGNLSATSEEATWVLTSYLISNAIKYAPDGRALSVRAFSDQNRVHVQISDQGPGIPPEERDAFMSRYKTAAGFAIERLNAAPPIIASGARVGPEPAAVCCSTTSS